ncbi:alpha/beta hydrolase family esterase [Methylobacterium sp. J-090]|uniref:extracellular catalytic domain type 1 short-chain-length polyhydroxyalkanoate depolymerase n=1 Tax=Methylobacterium sp. J-090 TaxID=2836666 RepID=UPI001FB97054|nr:PHB depolymerase family esterase [Methylobacterium sp. J-090]MCJ2081166.1 PHB depolymerase family esterase [Methylobacterium sp. J-090]
MAPFNAATFSAIDMAAVTRLTQAGRLSEAMALLQGKPIPEADAPKDATRPRPILDMVAPTDAAGAWTAPDARAEAPTQPDLAQPDLTQALRSLSERFAKAGGLTGGLAAAMPNLEGLGQGLGQGFGRTPATKPVPVPEGARFETRRFTGAHGARDYKVYVPSGRAGETLPVIVMLHGCTQSPDDFAAGTRMNALAEAQGFLVAYPAQPPSANAQKCWNWFNAGDQQREGGEPALIAGIARAVLAEFGGDGTRVYVAGLSAGGAAAAIMAATYPDLFAAVGVHSGLACGAARDMPSAFAAMNGGGAVQARGNGPAVPTIVFHGDGDRTVHPVNGERVIAQATPAEGLGTTVTKGTSPGGTRYTRTVRTDADGRAQLEHWLLHGTGHAWSGGSPDGSYTDPRGPDASAEMVRFFLAQALAKSPTRH